MEQLAQISEQYRDHQNEQITDKLDHFSKMDTELKKNLTFVGTCHHEQEYKKDNYYDFLLHDEILHNLGTQQLFIKNIRIRGIIDDNGNKLFEYIDLVIAAQRIDRIYNNIYDVVSKRNKLGAHAHAQIGPLILTMYLRNYIKEIYILNEIMINNDNDVILPYDILPRPVYHDTNIKLKTSNTKEDYSHLKIKVSYDVYSYDTTKPSIYSDIYYNFNTVAPGFRSQHLIEQIQLDTTPYDFGTKKYRLNFWGIINCIAINIPEEIENEILISFNGWNKRLPFSYRLGSFAVYEFPRINFSQIDNVSLHMFLPKMENYYTVYIYAFNINALVHSYGMCGMKYA
jgi:hypothetical protein